MALKREYFAYNNSNLLFFYMAKIAITDNKIATNSIKIAIIVNSNLDAVNANLSPVNDYLAGTNKQQHIGDIIEKLDLS